MIYNLYSEIIQHESRFKIITTPIVLSKRAYKEKDKFHITKTKSIKIRQKISAILGTTGERSIAKGKLQSSNCISTQTRKNYKSATYIKLNGKVILP